MIFDAKGKFLKSWGKGFEHGLHGMTLVREAAGEFLYLAHTSHHEVLKTSLDGQIIWRLPYPEASKIYSKKTEFRPTAVAVAPSGDIFVADGYGKSYIHHYDKDRKYLGIIAGPGSAPGKLRTPHGLFMDSRKKTPELLVCDRENNRLQRFSLKGKHLGVIDGIFRRPCNISVHGTDLAVADLAGRVTIINGKNELVCHLGDNPDPKKRARNGIPRDQWQDGQFLSPHGVAFDAQGNLYVADWNFLGRVTKLKRLKN